MPAACLVSNMPSGRPYTPGASTRLGRGLTEFLYGKIDLESETLKLYESEDRQ
jgi:hypothetical protein